MASILKALCSLLALCVCAPVFACQSCVKTPQVVYSPNGQYRIRSDAGSKSIFRLEEDTPLWRFKPASASHEFFVSNDGTTVAEMVRAIRANEARDMRGIVIWRKEGKVGHFDTAQFGSPALAANLYWHVQCWQEGNTLMVAVPGQTARRVDLAEIKLVPAGHNRYAGSVPLCGNGGDDGRPEIDREAVALVIGTTFLLLFGMAYDIRRRRRESPAANRAIWRHPLDC